MQLRTAKAPLVFPVAQPAPTRPHQATETNQAAQHSVMTLSVATEKPKTDVYGEFAVQDDEGCPLV